MITDRLDPPGILKVPEIVNVSVATGSRIIQISGQTAVDAEGKVVKAQVFRGFKSHLHRY